LTLLSDITPCSPRRNLKTGNILPLHEWQDFGVRRSNLAQYLGIIVRKHRKSLKTTQEQLSERADIDVRMVRLIETKGQNVSVNVAEGVAQAFGVPLSQMIKEAEELRKRKPL
jgi:ribosome-binding protein aMBF1 (putative translation factor)